ncbi:MAG: DUF4886 domain-containing protein [Deltaproteobacteria bacterium]|nr:DUF4886 domain-containing protein [Deltaproteobacteria bacterium]
MHLNRSLLLSTLCAAAVLLIATSTTRAEQAATPLSQREIKVLGIGNSFTVNAFAFLGPMGAQSEKCRVTLGRAIIGGCSMEKHMRLAKLHDADGEDPEGKPYTLTVRDGEGKETRVKAGLREVLASDKWDVVTIQQVSAQSPNVESYRPYAKELYDYVRKYAPQAEVVLHQTWAYRVDGDFDKVFPDKPGYGQKEMYRDLDEAYRTIAKELGVRLIPVGVAFQVAREVRPYVPDETVDRSSLMPPALPKQENSLCVGYSWSGTEPRQLRCDSHHAGVRGEYLAACVWFAFLTGLNPYAEGIRVERISDEDAAFLSGIAHEVMAKGRRPAQER